MQQTTRLRAWREAHGLTLGEVSGLTGYSEAYLSRLERGERGMRPMDRVRLARATGAAVGDLFEPGSREEIR